MYSIVSSSYAPDKDLYRQIQGVRTFTPPWGKMSSVITLAAEGWCSSQDAA